MAENADSKLEISPEFRTTGATKMSLAVEMQNGIKELGADGKNGGNRETMIAHAARQAGITFRQAKTFFYAESENPRGKAIEAVRAAIARKEQEKAASNELTELRQRIARIEQLLDTRAANRHRSGSSLDRQEDSGEGRKAGSAHRAMDR